MTKEEYFIFHKAACDKMIEITRAKNADYSGTSVDPFSNFAKVEVLGICTTEQGFLTRMFDKFARITSFVQKGVLEVKDESVEDTLFDLANYCILMAGFIKAKKIASLPAEARWIFSDFMRIEVRDHKPQEMKVKLVRDPHLCAVFYSDENRSKFGELHWHSISILETGMYRVKFDSINPDLYQNPILSNRRGEHENA